MSPINFLEEQAVQQVAPFNLDERDDTITIALNLPEEECNIVNDELDKAVKYWKTIALENCTEDGLELKAPKCRKLIPIKKNLKKKI